MSITNERFKECLLAYKREKNFTHAQLTQDLKKPSSTVGDWMTKGIQRDKVRNRTAEEYPHIFGENIPVETLPQSNVPVLTSVSFKPIQTDPQRELALTLKQEFARQNVVSLVEVLRWFVFDASGSEREKFREELGETWTDLLNLTRAMTGEMARNVTITEGRLNKWLQK